MAHFTQRRDYYSVLGLQPSSSFEAVRNAYRSLARELHPDLNPSPDAADRFKEVSEAYRILSDPTQRRLYDAQRRPLDQPVKASMPAATTRSASRGVLRGRDVELAVRLSFREAILGTELPLDLARREVCALCIGSGAAKGGSSIRCPRCLGTGGTRANGDECSSCLGSGVIGEPPCPNCGGAGRRDGISRCTVKIPPCVEDGQRLVLKGDGDAGPRNGPRGDLILTIAVEPDPVLRRAGIDILMDLTISAESAEYGTNVDVPTLKGEKRLRIPDGVLDGQIFRIGGAGIRLPGMHWHRGDQFVTVHLLHDESTEQLPG